MIILQVVVFDLHKIQKNSEKDSQHYQSAVNLHTFKLHFIPVCQVSGIAQTRYNV